MKLTNLKIKSFETSLTPGEAAGIHGGNGLPIIIDNPPPDKNKTKIPVMIGEGDPDGYGDGLG